MATLGNVRDWVGSSKLKRTDIDTQLLDMAQETYYTICAAVPFPNLEVISSEIPLVASQAYVDISSLTDVCGILSVVLMDNGVKSRRLRQTNGRLLDNITGSRVSRPYRYARRGTVLEIDPAPSGSTYGIIIRYWKYPTLASPVANTNLVYPPEWLELHKFETLYRAYIYLENYAAAQNLVMPSVLPRYPAAKKTVTHEVGIIPRLWNDLLTNMRAKEAYDSDYSINPILRRYTAV